jgi:hypothetical protein
MLPGLKSAIAGAGRASFAGLTYKGHGGHGVTNGTFTLNYGTVSGGSAPSAGDFVIWNTVVLYQPAPTSPGWSVSSLASSALGGGFFLHSGFYAKVVSAGDISSPPTLVTVSSSNMAAGMWAAFTLNGEPEALSVPTQNVQDSGASAPSNQTVDSSALSAPATAITLAAGLGSDGAITVGGITFDQSILLLDVYSGIDVRLGYKLDVGGASYTISKVDDGNNNGLVSGYISIS